LPDAVKAFGVSKAWRFWSLDDPSLHQAMYQFDDEARLTAMLKGDAMKQLVADFNRDWPDVTRTRETLVLAQELGNSAPGYESCPLRNEPERVIQLWFMS
jgi:hypothetical protein